MNLNHRSKYSAVAAAVAVACAVGANQGADAATVQAGATLTLAQQYVAAASASAAQAVTFGVSLGADYVSGDRIRVVLAGAEYQTTSAISAPTGTAAAGTCTLSVLGFADATTANFRVPASLPNGTPCVFTMPIKTSTVGSSATLTFSSLFSTGEALEGATTAKTVITTTDQFSASVVKVLAGVVDVERARYHFAADDTSAASTLAGNESQLVVSLGNATSAVSPVGMASVAAVTVSVTGDFTFG